MTCNLYKTVDQTELRLAHTHPKISKNSELVIWLINEYTLFIILYYKGNLSLRIWSPHSNLEVS